MNLTEYITHVRNYLVDPTAVKYTDGMITEGIRQALWEYSAACPHMMGSEITVVSALRDQVLTSLSGSTVGLQTVLEVYYPYTPNEVVHNVVEDYYQYMTSGSVALNLQAITPAVGQKFFVRYAANHTINALDGATLTSIRAEHDYTIILGSAGFAIKTRVNLVSESYGTRGEDINQLTRYADELLSKFSQRLEKARQETVNTQGPYSINKWHLDQWDVK